MGVSIVFFMCVGGVAKAYDDAMEVAATFYGVAKGAVSADEGPSTTNFEKTMVLPPVDILDPTFQLKYGLQTSAFCDAELVVATPFNVTDLTATGVAPFPRF